MLVLKSKLQVKKKPTKLFIIKSGFTSEIVTSEAEFITFDNFKILFNKKNIFNRIFSYDVVGLHVYKINLINYPLITLVLLRLISRTTPFIKDNSGEIQYVTFKSLWYAFRRFVKDLIDKNSLIESVDKRLTEEFLPLQLIGKKRKPISQGSVVYLRTDLWFGLTSGGSIGHIAGVLNNLDGFFGNPLFITTDFIPTVNANIPISVLQPTNRYWDFSEIPSIASNNNFVKQSLYVIGNSSPAFIYQRYSVNNYLGVQLSDYYKVPFVLEYNGS